MRRILVLLLLVLPVLLLVGCSESLYPIMKTAADGAPQIVGQVKDASVSRDSLVHATLQNRDIQYKKAYSESGMTISWKAHDIKFQVPGLDQPYVVTQFLPDIEFKESPKFDQPLPTKPADHPVWAFLTNVTDKTLIGWWLHELGGVLRGAEGRQNYYGAYNPQNSNNTAGQYQAFSPEMLNSGGYQPFEAPVFAPKGSELVE